MAWSPDGTRLGLVNLPGRAAAEVWVLEMATGQLRKIADWPAPAEFEGYFVDTGWPIAGDRPFGG